MLSNKVDDLEHTQKNALAWNGLNNLKLIKETLKSQILVWKKNEIMAPVADSVPFPH